jgi:hypothetical protein
MADAIEALRNRLRAAAESSPETLAATIKDVGVLVKLIRNPADQPDEPKFRKVRLRSGPPIAATTLT